MHEWWIRSYFTELFQEKRKRAEEAQKLGQTADTNEEGKEERVITLRPLNMEDFRQAKNQVMYINELAFICESREEEDELKWMNIVLRLQRGSAMFLLCQPWCF